MSSLPTSYIPRRKGRSLAGLGALALLCALLSLCLGAPMLLQLKGGIDRTLVMLPASVMMLTGIWYNLNQEYIVVKGYDAYRPFL